MCVLFYPETVKNSVAKSMENVFFSVLPPLFCFIFAGDILLQTPFVRLFYTKPMRKIGKILKLSSEEAFVAFSGMIFGFPSGAAGASRLLASGKINKSKASRLIAFSNNPSPAFLVAVVGKSVMKSGAFGWTLYFSSVISTLFIACFSGEKDTYMHVQNCGNKEYDGIGKIIASAAEKGISACLNICAYTAVFGVVCDMIFLIFPSFSPFVRAMLSGVLEITRGVFESGEISNIFFRLIAVSFALGFSGISVAMQISSLVEKYGVSMKKYFFYRLIYVLGYLFLGIFFIIFQ